MSDNPVKRYVTVGTVLAANRRVQENGPVQRHVATGMFLSSGKRVDKPTRLELEAAGRRALSTELSKKRA